MQQSVLLKSPFVANTGYGHDGFALAQAFYQAGLDTHLLPMVVSPPIPMGVAQLMTKQPLDEYDFFVHHTDPEQLGLDDGEKRLKAKKVAWSMWEFTGLDPKIAETMTERLDGYDLLLVYDEVSAQALGPHAEAAGVPLKIIQGGYWAEEWEYDVRQRQWPSDENPGPFRFVMAGQLHLRKNPFAAINAFNRIREEFSHAELHLKTNVRFLHPAMEQSYPGLKIFYEIWPKERLKQFYADAHCYVAPSWGEGKNLPALEAQTMGVPAIYSDFGGHRQWGSSEFGWPVGGELMDHTNGDGLFSIRVDEEKLYEAMKEAISDPSATRMKGEKASRLIPSMCDWSSVVQRFLVMCR